MLPAGPFAVMFRPSASVTYVSAPPPRLAWVTCWPKASLVEVTVLLDVDCVASVPRAV